MKIDDAAARLEALGNPTGLRIYRALVRAGDAGLSVGKLQAKLELAASTAARHSRCILAGGPQNARGWLAAFSVLAVGIAAGPLMLLWSRTVRAKRTAVSAPTKP